MAKRTNGSGRVVFSLDICVRMDGQALAADRREEGMEDTLWHACWSGLGHDEVCLATCRFGVVVVVG